MNQAHLRGDAREQLDGPETSARVGERVSVVIPCFNAERFIEVTLRSVLLQTTAPFEIIVVDDGSTDRSAELAERVDASVRVIRIPNGGESRARNLGFNEARGDWVAFLDSDDVWLPEKLATQLAVCRTRPDVVCCHTWVTLDYGDVQVSPELIPELRSGDYSLMNMLLHFMVHPSTAMVRRSSSARFAEWTRDGEDLLYFADLSMEGPFAFIPRELVRYRKHAQSQSSDVGNIVRNRQSCFRWLELNRTKLSAREATEVKGRLVSDLLARMLNAKWKREWERYWAIRRFLVEHLAGETLPPTLRERIWPPFAYYLRDLLGAASPAAGTSGR